MPPKSCKPPRFSENQRVQFWKRVAIMLLCLIATTQQQWALDYLMGRRSLEEEENVIQELPEKKDKKKTKAPMTIRRGIGPPLPRSTACKTWSKEPSECVHPEDHLRQRSSKGHFWWTCLMCGSRWVRLECDADFNENQKAHGNQTRGSTTEPVMVTTSSTVAYPKQLPPPRSRPDLPTLNLVEHDNFDGPIPHQAAAVKKLREQMQREKSTPMFPSFGNPPPWPVKVKEESLEKTSGSTTPRRSRPSGQV